MLNFACHEDPVFTAIFYDALEEVREWLVHKLTGGDSEWGVQYPRIAACFAPGRRST